MSLYQRYLDYLNQAMPDISGIFRTTPAQAVEETTEETVAQPVGITPQLLQLSGGSGGDGFSVYNPDPTRTRTSDQYSPYAYRQAAERNLIGTMGGALTGTQIPNTSTEVAKLMDMYPEYYQGKQLTGIPGAALNYLENSFLGKGLDSLSSMLPVNRRAIIENEALGAGFRLNDIGQIVAAPGSAYDPSGLNIMAGYNLAKIDQSTFDKRRERAKKNMTPEGYEEFNRALTAAEEKILGSKGIKTKADLVFDDISLQKDPTYQTLEEKIALGLAEGDDDDDDYNFEDYIASISPYQIPTGITSSYPGAVLLNQRNVTRTEDARRALEASRQREAEAAAAAAGGDRQEQARQRARDQQRIDAANRAFRDDPGAQSYSGGERTTNVGGQNITTYDDPFDPGGGE